MISPTMDQPPNIELPERREWVECLHWDSGLTILHSSTWCRQFTTNKKILLCIKLYKIIFKMNNFKEK